MGAIFNPEKGTWVLFSFVAFFAVIVAVNSVFITTALSTHSGVVTDRPYERGLAFDEILETARSQPDLIQHATFERGILRWVLHDEDGEPLQADVQARLFRPVQGGQDFDIALTSKGSGIYEAHLDLPMKGRWDAQLKAAWDNTQYQTRYSFTAK